MKKILYLAIASLLLTACDRTDDGEKRNTNFSVPELTASNTIQFTVTTEANEYASVILKGGKIAVDWGDGTVTKDIDPESGESWRTEFTHIYKTPGEHKVKIWSDEVSFINISSLLAAYEQLQFGNCPVLTYAYLNSFTKDKTLDLNGCTNLEQLNLGNWEQLESVVVDDCAELLEILAYTNPKLKTFDVSQNAKLASFTCQDSALENLKLPAGILNVNCKNNKFKAITLENFKELRVLGCSDNADLISLDLSGCDKLSILQLSNTQIASFDFSEFPELGMIYCGNSKLTSVDVTKCTDLGMLHCQNLGLTSLDISHNNLTLLNCSGNKLASLDVSPSTGFRFLYLNDNLFDKAALEAIFTALPTFSTAVPMASMPPPAPPSSQISVFGNPGAADCDQKIVTDKGWVVVTS